MAPVIKTLNSMNIFVAAGRLTSLFEYLQSLLILCLHSLL
jgi:hypothetical protein